jgi:progressive ankylosis protein
VLTLRLSARSIFTFWAPLAATWLMMAFEGPFLAAIIARLADPKFNLAAFGVSSAFAILVEAPVIMMMSASTALVEDADSYRKLRNFTFTLNGIVTAGMLIVLVPAVFQTIMRDIIGLPPEVTKLVHGSLALLLPWPGAIGYRRFFQGLLIRGGRTRLVAYGTVVRLSVMTGTAIVLFALWDISGAYVGAAALAAGVSAEAIASRFMALRTVRELLGTPSSAHQEILDYRRIIDFYYPLALTSVIGLVVQPMLTLFMGRSRFPVESLAVFPVVYTLSFIFRALGLSFQEVSIALLGRNLEHRRELGRFATALALSASLGLAMIAFTPLASVWFRSVSGLSADLAAFGVTPLRILAAIPALSVLMSFQRSLLVTGRRTRPITWATVLEVVGVASMFPVLNAVLDTTGVTAAAIAFLCGRLAGNIYLIPPCLRVVTQPMPVSSATTPSPPLTDGEKEAQTS